MATRESALWQTLSRYVPSGGMAVRIENSADSGMPDVLLTYRSTTTLVELKSINKLEPPFDVTPKQADWARRWHRAGGTSWFLIAYQRWYYLIPGSWNPALLKNIDTWRVNDLDEAIQLMTL